MFEIQPREQYTKSHAENCCYERILNRILLKNALTLKLFLSVKSVHRHLIKNENLS